MDPLGSQVSERKMRTRTYGRVAWTVAWTVAEFSLVKEEKVEVEKWEVEKWEVRPSGMLVQMRNAYDDVVGEPAPTIRVKVKYCSAYHEINISAQATFGEMKKELSARMGFHPLNMKLMYKEKERESATFLDVVGVKDRSKILLMEDPMPKAKCILEMHKTDKIDKAAKSVSAICLEVDRLASKVFILLPFLPTPTTSIFQGFDEDFGEMEVARYLSWQEVVVSNGNFKQSQRESYRGLTSDDLSA